MEKIIGYIGLGLLIFLIVGYILKVILVSRAHYLLEHPEKDKTRCKSCKANMDLTATKLYVIPVFFDKTHEESPEYYVENAEEIASEEDIPSGKRACRMKVFHCPSCGNRHVEVMDFLRTSTMETPYNFEMYEYEALRELLER